MYFFLKLVNMYRSFVAFCFRTPLTRHFAKISIGNFLDHLVLIGILLFSHFVKILRFFSGLAIFKYLHLIYICPSSYKERYCRLIWSKIESTMLRMNQRYGTYSTIEVSLDGAGGGLEQAEGDCTKMKLDQTRGGDD
jgi:hypothetical protein